MGRRPPNDPWGTSCQNLLHLQGCPHAKGRKERKKKKKKKKKQQKEKVAKCVLSKLS